MEIINKQDQTGQKVPSAQKPWAHHLYLGIALIGVGLIWMLYNFDVIGYKFFDVFFSWQMLLVVIGGYFLSMKKWALGAIVTLTGAFFVATDLLGVHIPFDKVVLPLICIIAGLAVLLTRKYR